MRKTRNVEPVASVASEYIALSVWEYQRLMAIEAKMDILKNMAVSNKYFGIDEVRALLGIKKPEKEGAE